MGMIAQWHGLAITTATPGIALPHLYFNGQGIIGFGCHKVELIEWSVWMIIS